MDVCLICLSELSDIRKRTSEILPRTKSTVGDFLEEHHVITFNQKSRQSLCGGCFQLVIRCDDLQFQYEEAVRALKQKSRKNDFSTVDVSDVLEPELVKDGELRSQYGDLTESCHEPSLDDSFSPVRRSTRRKRPNCGKIEYSHGPSRVKRAKSSGPERESAEEKSSEVAAEVSRVEKSKEPLKSLSAAKKLREDEARPKSAKFCPLCGEKALPRKFADHLRLLHPESKRIKALPVDFLRCNVDGCTYQTRYKQRLQNHQLQKHRIGKLLECPDCSQKFAAKDRLLAHQHKMHGKEKTYKCDVCGKDYSTYMGWYLHSKSHETVVRLRVCTECGEEVDSRQYSNHVKKKHRPKKLPESANCEHCGQFFKSKVNLKRHMARFHGIGELKLRSNNILKECSHCGKSMKTDERFRAHMFQEHGVELPGLKKRECVICKEIFYVKVQYDAHMMLHSGVKKYACDRCDYSTRFSANLVSHKRRSHCKKKESLIAAEPSSPVDLPSATKSDPAPVDLSSHRDPSALSQAPPNTIILVQGSNFLVPLSVGLPISQELVVTPCVDPISIPVSLEEVQSGKVTMKAEVSKARSYANFKSGVEEIDVPGNKSVVIFVPFPQLKAYQKIQTRLVRELEKKFSGKHVVFIARRKMLKKPTRQMRVKSKQKMPRSRTLTVVHEAVLEDVVFPSEIVGKRTRVKLDGSRLIKVHLDENQQTNVQQKIYTFKSVYKKLTGKDVDFKFPESIL